MSGPSAMLADILSRSGNSVLKATVRLGHGHRVLDGTTLAWICTPAAGVFQHQRVAQAQRFAVHLVGPAAFHGFRNRRRCKIFAHLVAIRGVILSLATRTA